MMILSRVTQIVPINTEILTQMLGMSLAIQWLSLCVSNAGGTGSVSSWETKIPHALWPKKICIYGRVTLLYT